MEPSLWRSARELHPKFLAHAVNTQLFGLEYFYIDIPFHYHLFAFNLYPIALKFSANVLHKFCVVLFMQSAFTIRNMDSTPEPPSPNMAAAAPNKRKLRKCTNCTSRMPSFFYDNHTLCTKCRNQVCDMQLVCEECRDWPVTKRKIFVNYNHKLRIKRESKQRQARLASAASDQSVYDTDTDVPLDEPSVPVPDMHLDNLNLGQQQCLISEEVVVSAGPSTETATSDLLLIPPGSDLDKLAFTVLSRLSDLQSARGPQTTVPSQSMPTGLSQQALILPNVCQPSVQSLSAGSTISQQGIILPNVCQSSVQAGSGISQPGVILPNVCQSVFTNNEVEGVTAPPPLFANPAQPVFRLPTAPIPSGVQHETPQNPVASEEGIQTLQEALSSIHQTIASLTANGISLPQSLLDSASSLAKKLQDARLSSPRPGVSSSAKPRSPQWGPARPETTRRVPETTRKVPEATSRVPETTRRGPETTRRTPETTQRAPDRPESTPMGPGRPDFDPAVPGLSKRRSFDSPQCSSDHSSRQGSHTPPRKRRRHSGNSSDEDPASQNRQQRDNQQDEEDNFRPSSLDLLLNYITRKFPAASQPLVQPSSKRFHVMESAGLVDESSHQASNLAWFGHMRSACDSAQRKFEAKVSEEKSLSSILTAVSRTERVSDSPCQGRATKVNSQVFDLMSSRPPDSRSVLLSVREATSLETALRGVMESYNFQLWTVTALFRFLGDSDCCPMDDPLLDQFQRSFSRGAENVAAALASTTAFVSAKRRESFLSHMFPSVTDAQKRKLLSDPLFDQKDLFAPAREAARDFSLYRGAQSRPSTSSGSYQRRQFSSSNSRGRHNASPRSTSHRSQASSSSSGRFQQKKKLSDPPRKRGGFRK